MTDSQKPRTVEEYLARLESPVREFLGELRELSREAAPHTEEGLKWGSPAYWTDTILFQFSGHRHHANFVFTPSTKEASAAEITEFAAAKSSVKLPYDAPIPHALLRRMIAHRLSEFEDDGVRWM